MAPNRLEVGNKRAIQMEIFENFNRAKKGGSGENRINSIEKLHYLVSFHQNLIREGWHNFRGVWKLCPIF